MSNYMRTIDREIRLIDLAVRGPLSSPFLPTRAVIGWAAVPQMGCGSWDASYVHVSHTNLHRTSSSFSDANSFHRQYRKTRIRDLWDKT